MILCIIVDISVSTLNRPTVYKKTATGSQNSACNTGLLAEGR